MKEFLVLQKGIVYGPVLSRRLGRSLGINILSPYRKICSFDCSYCQYGPTTMHTMQPPREAFPTSDEILGEVEKALVIHRHLDHLTFSGNGEPTLHPEFSSIAKGIRDLRDRYRPDVRIALFTNSTNLGNPDVQEGIGYIDFPIFKLDAGNQEMLERIDHPANGIRIESIIEQLSPLKEITIQSLFVAGEMEDLGNRHFQAWLLAIQKIKPKTIQLYSCDWSIPSRGVEKLPQYKLSRIADSIRDKCDCEVEIY
jgi:wyosine [tRNA(Phe)-imidazoG37] synthetase (radical SAM superfamily)